MLRFQLMGLIDDKPPLAAPPPVVAFVLGWAGVLPFVVCAAAVIFGHPAAAGTALAALVSYGSIILGFMGGVHWGLEMGQPRSPVVYVASVVPALIAFAATLLQATYGIALLISGFAGLLGYDLSRVHSGSAPGWYSGLRWQLSGAVMAVLVATALFS